MEQDDRTLGVCPHCEETQGAVGEPCKSRLCQKKSYHLIRTDQMEKAKAEAERKHCEIDSLLGKRISKYILIGKLGEGGMGAVYRALQMPLRREVALKIISAPDVDDIALRRFAREASAMSLLEHPNIVKLYDFGPEDYHESMPYMVLELVTGRTLREEMEKRRRAATGWKTEELRRLFEQILSGLETAHRAALFHRDIKPDNIMLTKIVGDQNHVKILDFGLARAVEQLQGIEKLSKTGMLMGTPAFMAPEQFLVQRAGDVDYRVDLYATGVIMFEVLLGKKPFVARTWKEVASFKLSPAYHPLQELEGLAIPKPIEAFLTKALAREPDERFQNAMEMSEAFALAIRGESPAVPYRGARLQQTIALPKTDEGEFRARGLLRPPSRSRDGVPPTDGSDNRPLQPEMIDGTADPVPHVGSQELQRVVPGSTKVVRSTTRPLSAGEATAGLSPSVPPPNAPQRSVALLAPATETHPPAPEAPPPAQEAPAPARETPPPAQSPRHQAASPSRAILDLEPPRSSAFDNDPFPNFGRRKLVGVAVVVVLLAIAAWTSVWIVKRNRVVAPATEVPRQTAPGPEAPSQPSGVAAPSKTAKPPDAGRDELDKRDLETPQTNAPTAAHPATPMEPAPSTAPAEPVPPMPAPLPVAAPAAPEGTPPSKTSPPTTSNPSTSPPGLPAASKAVTAGKPAPKPMPKPAPKPAPGRAAKPKPKPAPKKNSVSKELDEMLDMDF